MVTVDVLMQFGDEFMQEESRQDNKRKNKPRLSKSNTENLYEQIKDLYT